MGRKTEPPAAVAWNRWRITQVPLEVRQWSVERIYTSCQSDQAVPRIGYGELEVGKHRGTDRCVYLELRHQN